MSSFTSIRRDTPPPDEVDPYAYNPSMAVAIAFTVIFWLVTVRHLYLNFVYARTQAIPHKYTICLSIAGWISVTGWTWRIVSIHFQHTWPLSIIFYAISQSSIVVAPVFFCATLYLLLTRMIRFNLPEADKDGGKSPQVFFGLSPKRLGYVFLISDFTSFSTQGGGSGIAGAGGWKGILRTIGMDIIIVGLALQLLTFTAFIAVLAIFQTRVNRRDDVILQPGAKRVIRAVWVASFFIQVGSFFACYPPKNDHPSVEKALANEELPKHQIRTAYRLIEFAMGDNAYLMTNEWCLYVFEAGPTAIALATLAVFHPVIYMQQHRAVMSPDSEIALESTSRLESATEPEPKSKSGFKPPLIPTPLGLVIRALRKSR
ncbi:hypothetical protein PV08_10849 [Exophiala spinifera]|uniref:RTA1 domain protein n=1 Tax=Exophiala spinifera TaxID=91928 RepID=A0A0D2AXZ2_9EURO|nr:uncharacterized protein PV08_10849 [Exophiala spinifera]KIW11548.1 hypothetical protein PV08_10849 [Exophiala spinifera]